MSKNQEQVDLNRKEHPVTSAPLDTTKFTSNLAGTKGKDIQTAFETLDKLTVGAAAPAAGSVTVKGSVDMTVAPTPAPKAGDIFFSSKAGVVHAGYGGGNVAVGEGRIFDGTTWHEMTHPGAANLGGSVDLTAAPVTAPNPGSIFTATTSGTANAAYGGGAVTAGNSYIFIGGTLTQLQGASAGTAGGAGNAGILPKTDASGLISNTFINGVATGGTTASAGKVVFLDASGKIDRTLEQTGSMRFVGSVDATTGAAEPAGAFEGDVYRNTGTGAGAAWNGLTGLSVGDLIIRGATGWTKLTSGAVLGGMTFKGDADPNNAAPTAPTRGDTYRMIAAGAAVASWGTLGTVGRDNFVMWDGGAWRNITGLMPRVLQYAGAEDFTAALPAHPWAVGDVVLNTAAGAIHASWIGMAGVNAKIGDMAVYRGTVDGWDLVGSHADLQAAVLRDGSQKAFAALSMAGVKLELKADGTVPASPADATQAFSQITPTRASATEGGAKVQVLKAGVLTDAVTVDGTGAVVAGTVTIAPATANAHAVQKQQLDTAVTKLTTDKATKFIGAAPPVGMTDGDIWTDAGVTKTYIGGAWVQMAKDAPHMTWKGGIDFKNAAVVPATKEVGDIYIATSSGTANAGWTGLTTVTAGNAYVWDGAAWTQLGGSATSTVPAGMMRMRGRLDLRSNPSTAPSVGDMFIAIATGTAGASYGGGHVEAGEVYVFSPGSTLTHLQPAMADLLGGTGKVGVLPKTGATGTISNTFIDGTAVGGAVADAGKVPFLDAAGKLAATLLPKFGSMNFKGSVDATAGATEPTGSAEGDVYSNTGTGAGAAWNGIAALTAGDLILRAASGWVILASKTAATGAMIYRGEVDMTTAGGVPLTRADGDVYLSTVSGTPHVGWTGIVGDVQKGESFVWSGAAWHRLSRGGAGAFGGGLRFDYNGADISQPAGTRDVAPGAVHFALSNMLSTTNTGWGRSVGQQIADVNAPWVLQKGQLFVYIDDGLYAPLQTKASLTSRFGGAAAPHDDGHLVETSSSGLIDMSFLDFVVAGGTTAEAGKLVALDSTGKVAASMLPTAASLGGVTYKGTVDGTAGGMTAPTGWTVGSMYLNTGTGAGAAWNSIPALSVNDVLLRTSSGWIVLARGTQLGFLPLSGNVPMTGDLETRGVNLQDATGTLASFVPVRGDAVGGGFKIQALTNGKIVDTSLSVPTAGQLEGRTRGTHIGMAGGKTALGSMCYRHQSIFQQTRDRCRSTPGKFATPTYQAFPTGYDLTKPQTVFIEPIYITKEGCVIGFAGTGGAGYRMGLFDPVTGKGEVFEFPKAGLSNRTSWAMGADGQLVGVSCDSLYDASISILDTGTMQITTHVQTDKAFKSKYNRNLVLAPDGNLYVLSNTDLFKLAHPYTGSLTIVPGTSYTSLSNPGMSLPSNEGTVVIPDGRLAIPTGLLDVFTGVVTAYPTGDTPGNMRILPDGRMIGVGMILDPVTGTKRAINPNVAMANTMLPDGRVVGVTLNFGPPQLWIYDPYLDTYEQLAITGVPDAATLYLSDIKLLPDGRLIGSPVSTWDPWIVIDMGFTEATSFPPEFLLGNTMNTYIHSI